MTVTGVGRETVHLEEATYGDVLEAVGLDRAEATPLVDGRPVPVDRLVDAEEVTVLRLVHGG